MVSPVEPQSPSTKEKKGAASQAPPAKEGEYPVVERLTTPEVPEGVEKVEAIAGAEIALPQPVTDDSGQVIVGSSDPQQVSITLPLTDEEMEKALHLKIIYSIRWLAEWTKRLLKKAQGKFAYRKKQ